MSTGFISGNRTDLNKIYNIVQNNFISYTKDIIISTLKEFFAKDSYYHYVYDQWGFAKVNDHTDQNINAGIHDDLTTRVYIGEVGRFNVIHYPSILVSSNGVRHVPISINRDQGRIDYQTTTFIDGLGNEKKIQVPYAFILSGAWEGSITIDIYARGIREKDDLLELISILFIDLAWNDLYRAGVAIKQDVQVGSLGFSDDRNDRLYKQSITLNVRTEWRREIPILNTLDTINFCVDFGNLSVEPPEIAPNLTINMEIDLLDGINNLWKVKIYQ